MRVPATPAFIDGTARESSSLALLARESEMALARRALALAAAGQGGMLLVSGEAGMGKTRLCEEIRAEARSMGMIDLFGRAYPGDSELPFAPLGDALCAERRIPDSPVWARLSQHADVLAAMSSTLPGSVHPSSPRRLPPMDLRGFVERFLDVLDEVCQNAAGLLWVVEDMHWADEVTQRVLGYVARRLSRMRILVLATHCAQDLGPDHPWRRSVGVLRTLDHVRHLRLTPLEVGHRRALAQAAAGAELPDDVLADIVRNSAGNPVLVIELARAGVMGGSTMRPPLVVHDVVRRRLVQLGPLPRRVLSLAAVVGDELGPQLARLLCRSGDDDGADVEEAVEQLIGFGLLRRDGGDDGERLAFVHPFFREVAYTRLGAHERRDLHAAVAAALESTTGERPDEIAHHWERAHRQDRALAVLTRAAEDARRERRLGASADLTILAHELLQRNAERGDGRDDVHCRILAELAQLGRWTEALQFARETWWRRETLAPERNALLREVLARALMHTGAVAEAGDVLADELERAEREGRPLDVRLLAAVAEHAQAAGDPSALSLLEQALAEAGRAGDAEAQHRIADALTCAQFHLHRNRQAAAAEHALHLDHARRAGLVAAEARSLFRVATMTAAATDLRRAQGCADRIAGEVAPLTALARSLAFLFEGTTAAAESALAGITDGVLERFPRLAGTVESVRALTHLQRGALDDAASALVAAESAAGSGIAPGDRALLHAAGGWLAWEQGDTNAAAQAFAKSREWQRGGGLSPLDLGHAPVAWHVDALLREGGADEAADLVAAVTAEDSDPDPFTAASIAAARFRLDPTPLSAAAATSAAMQAPWPLLALTVATWRASLLGDSSSLATAGRIGAELGMHRAVARAGSEMRRAGCAGSARPRRTGLAGLSPREEEVADLVSSGLSNPAIARVLQVSERTVAVHVSHVLGKLGFSSRAQIARWVAEGAGRPGTRVSTGGGR